MIFSSLLSPVKILHYQASVSILPNYFYCENKRILIVLGFKVYIYSTIYVQYVSVPPTVSLDIGKALNLNDLEEGDDVYFECSISANPPPYKVTWLHNVSESSFFSHKHYVSELYLYL